MADILSCPFCDFTSSDSYFLILHVEELHTDDSPFKVTEPSEPPASSHTQTEKEQSHSGENAPSSTEEWVLCPEKDCDEQVYLSELNEHLDLHLAAGLTEPEHNSSTKRGKMFTPIASEHSFHAGQPSRHRHSKMRHRSSSQKTTLTRSILDFFLPSSKLKHGSKSNKENIKDYSARLGKSELGPYAFEDQMPTWLYEQLKAGGRKTTLNRIGRDGRLIKHEMIENEAPGILPMLAQLCALEKSVKHAYLCHPATLQIGKTRGEGSFCGYRNLQMLLSYIQGAKAQGHDRFSAGTPNILKLQDLIEEAWDKGINDIARAQTGGIRGTRKYIGTPEVEAVLRSMEIDHGIQIFTDRDNSQAYEQLLADIEGYFKSNVPKDALKTKVHKTCLPPVYLQQPGHSLTIVGFEEHYDGSCNLLVFDPQFNPTPGMMKILGRRELRSPRPEVLHVYRRGWRLLSQRRDFEMIKLTASPPLFPVWDVLARFDDIPYVYAFYLAPTGTYEIMPEDDFMPLFPWEMHGALYSTKDARFASKSTSSWCSFSIDGRPIYDSGLLGGMPVLMERNYLSWLNRDDNRLWGLSKHLRSDSMFDEDAMVIDSGNMDNKDSCYRHSSMTPTPIYQDGEAISGFISLNNINKENIPAAVSTNSLSSTCSHIAELPQDFFFMKSTEKDVPIHYACGMFYKPGSHHVDIGRCTTSPPNRSQGSGDSQGSEYQRVRARPWRSPPLTSLASSASSSWASTLSLPSSTTATSQDSGQVVLRPCPVYVRDNNGKLWLDLGSVDHGNELIGVTAAAAGKRESTPVHEMRDFFYERDAENSTPVFYGTGRQTMSSGWAARMEMEG